MKMYLWWIGLLHGIPDYERGSIEELLAECVEETEPGGRIQAAQDLRDLLSDLLLDEVEENAVPEQDKEEEEEEEEEDDDQYEEYEEDEDYNDNNIA